MHRTPVLRLYRFVEDAWSDGLRAWCEKASRAALEEGRQCWLIVAHCGQVRWIKNTALAAGVSLFGIRFLDPEMLREELCALLGIEVVSFASETSEFVLKTVASQRNDLDAASVAQNASACLEAMNELHSSGWSSDGLDLPRHLTRDFFENLKLARCWMPAMDRALVARAKRKRRALWSCVIGWDAARWPDLSLIEATARFSERCEVFLPLPHIAAENVHQLWIEAIEARLGASSEICDASGFHCGNEGLISRLENSHFASEVPRSPRLLVGHDCRSRVRLVRDDALAWLTDSASAGSTFSLGKRMAIVAPERSPTSIAVIRALAEAGIAVLDEIGENPEPSAAVRVQAQVVRYHLLGHDVSALIELCKLLNESVPELWRWLEPDMAHELLTDAFCTVQSRNARLLICGHTQARSGVWQEISRLVRMLDKWDGNLTWAEARRKWARCIAQIGFSGEMLEPLWSRTRNLLRGKRKFPARIFLEYLADVLAVRNAQRAPEAAFFHARVVVTTLLGAMNQTWNRVLFLDSNEGIWPIKPDENPFLDDAARAALNARRGRRGWLLTSVDRWAIEQARFVDLVENCSGEIVFAAAARDAEDTTRELSPNELVIRCLAESNASMNAALAQWQDAIRVCEIAPPELDASTRRHLQMVHASRRDPVIPFDRYLFNFHESNYEPDAWPATQLDLAITCPATFALGQIFGVEPVAHAGFQRREGAAVGAHAHAWLLRALGGEEKLQPFQLNDDPRARLDAEVKATMRRFAECFRNEGLALPLWWETCFRKAAWAARRCLAHVLNVTDGKSGWFYAMEKNARVPVKTPDGSLLLKGRFDLLFADRQTLDGARVIILDFKTGKGKTPRLSSLGKGIGYQFAAYFLMGKDSGTASVTVGEVRPQVATLDVFNDEQEVALRDALAPLARLQRDLKFGQRGALVTEHGSFERLPMATTPIDPRVLEQKAKLFLLAQ